MSTEEVLRAARSAKKKKQRRLDSIEGHVAELIVHKAGKVALEAIVAAFDAIIAGIVSEAKRGEINTSVAVVRMQALYAADIGRVDVSIIKKRLAIKSINDPVQADDDYTVAEKAEFQSIKDNEV